MNGKFLYTILLLIFLAVYQPPIECKKVIIHIPYRVKNVKHTHTIYKIIPHDEKSEDFEEDEKYEIYRK